jgi:hypothetical protein
MPPWPTLVVILGLGLLIPMTLGVDTKPADLAVSVAAQRYARFVRELPDDSLDLGPQGGVFSVRPTFFWPPLPEADRFVFRLYAADGTVQVVNEAVRAPYYRLRPPGSLTPGESYRFEVRAVASAGHPLHWPDRLEVKQGHFTVREPPDDLRALRRRIGLELGSAEGAFVLVGYFAARASPFDVISAYVASAELAKEPFARELRRPLRSADRLSRRIQRLVGG